jgi:TnpA family transposase
MSCRVIAVTGTGPNAGSTCRRRCDSYRAAICDYGPLQPIARNTINLAKITTPWPDMLRVAGSLVTNQVRAYDLLRMFGRDGHPTPLGQAFIEYGRIAKTLHLPALVDPIDGTYQRRMNRQLTVQESRPRLARKICHGNRGQIRQAYREGQEDQDRASARHRVVLALADGSCPSKAATRDSPTNSP